VASRPYYWTPPAAMLLEHFAHVGAAVKIPFYVYNAPEEMHGTRITTELCLRLIERIANFAGVVDLSLDWQFMIELLTYARHKRPDFALIAGAEHLVPAATVSAGAIYAPLPGSAPTLPRAAH